MNLSKGNHRAASLIPALFAGALCLATSISASAEAVKTVNGVDIDSSVVDLYIQSRAQMPAAQVPAEQRETMLNELTDIYLLTTQDAVKELQQDPQIAAQIELQRRGILAQAMASRFFSSSAITDEEIEAEYASQRELAPPLQFKARHILLESQGEATDIIGRLDDGADFAELAKSSSTGPSGPNGGDLGWFSPNQMVKPFSDAVAALEDGSYTASPVQTDFGWHVILREDSREAEAPPLDNVRNEIRNRLQQKKFQEYLEGLRSQNASSD